MRKITPRFIRSRLASALLAFAVVAAAMFADFRAAAEEKISVTPNFLNRRIGPADRIELKLSRRPSAEEGTVSVIVGDTDITSLFAFEGEGYVCPRHSPFIADGEHRLAVYLVDAAGAWSPLAEFPIIFAAAEPASAGLPAAGFGPAADAPPRKRGYELDFTPNVAINAKGQNQNLTFPRESAPERNPFGEVDGQANLQLKVSSRGWTLSNRFDLVGVGYLRNALRFGELKEEAPKVDLSSYLVELTKGRFALRLGHVSFGSNRHLINSFSSRGVTVTVPAGRGNEITFLAANGTSIVGYDNFLGVTRRKHSVVGVAFAREFFRERPGRLRFEVTAMRGSLLPLTNFNQREINDAETSIGLGFQIGGNLLKQRLRYSAGYNGSRFRNPRDPNVEGAGALKPIVPVSRGARHAEISFDFIQGLKVWDERKLKVTGTYRHEEVEPLFRSIAASTQADRRQNQFEVTASLGELAVTVGNLRDNDNLAEIASILRSITRRSNVIVSLPFNTFFTPAKPVKWLPRFSYTYDHVHQFGAAFPNGGEFNSASQIPDQDSFVQSANAQWQLTDRLSFGYRYNRAFQDNKQPGRDRADFQSAVNGLSVSYSPFKSLSFGIELSRERQRAFEQPRIDQMFRLGAQTTWQTSFLKNSTFSLNVSSAVAGDIENRGDTRNAEFDVQWAYRFGLGKKKFKKVEAQFFIRYANRYGDAIDRIAISRSFTKTQALNAGLTFNIF